MEYQAILCPACGATVHFRPGKHSTICEYCGSTVTSTEHDSRGDALEIADSINALIYPLEERNRCREELRDLKVRYNNNVKSYKRLRTMRIVEIYKYPAYCIALAILFLAGVYVSLFSLIAMLIAAALTYPLYRYGVHRYEVRVDDLRYTIREDMDSINVYQDELNAIEAETDFSIVPERYLNADALQFLVDVLYSGEAYDLHQAMAQYNTECKRRKERDALQEQLAAQKRQLDEIQANQQAANRKAAKDDDDDADIGDAIKTVAVTGAALYTGYKVIRNISRFM